MIRILVISDTHHKLSRIIDLLSGNHKFDHIIHLGDNVSDAEDIQSIFDIPITMVKGNCDFYTSGVHTDEVIEIEGISMFACHGHMYHVKGSTHLLRQLVDQHGYDIVLFGHTHRAMIEYYGESILMNPGSISLPRDGAPSFGVITIDNAKKAHVNIARIS